jgi:hypothetical protein|tara:strand:- start:501 stop:632 length:132 start_codon:yes stop_codon:yes gene_type:complete
MKLIKAMMNWEENNPIKADIIGAFCLFAMIPVFAFLLYGFGGN